MSKVRLMVPAVASITHRVHSATWSAVSAPATRPMASDYLGVAAGKKVPAVRLAAAAKQKGKTVQRARAAENARRANILGGASKMLYGK